MKQKINRPLLIISIAVAVFIIGLSIFITVYFDTPAGIFCSVGAFLLLLIFLIVENFLNKKK